jgi:hypothetical protein
LLTDEDEIKLHWCMIIAKVKMTGIVPGLHKCCTDP